MNILIQCYQVPEDDDKFTNLYGYQDDKEWLGYYVAREAFDHNYQYQPQMAVSLLNHYLAGVDRNNPLLNNELSGYIDSPFTII